MAALELRYRGLSSLSAQRRLRLERSRRLWKFLWDAGEEEAWMREQERLLRCPELGRDLPGALRMLSQLEAIRGALGTRAGPLEELLERGRELLVQGEPEGSTETTPGSTGGSKPSEPPAKSTESHTGPPESTPGPTAGLSSPTTAPSDRPASSTEPFVRPPELPEGPPEPSPPSPDPAAAVSRRLRELQCLWAALPALAGERERRLRAAAGRFQLNSEAAEAEAWLGAAARRLAGPELGHDERSAGMLERRLRELQDELRQRGAALAALREQSLPGDPTEPPEVLPGLAGRLEELQERLQELQERAERRRRELRDALGLFAARSEADACALWVADREQWLLAMEIPERIEDLEVVQQR